MKETFDPTEPVNTWTPLVVPLQGCVWSGAGHAVPWWTVHPAESVRRKTKETKCDQSLVPTSRPRLLYWYCNCRNFWPRKTAASVVLQLVTYTQKLTKRAVNILGVNRHDESIPFRRARIFSTQSNHPYEIAGPVKCRKEIVCPCSIVYYDIQCGQKFKWGIFSNIPSNSMFHVAQDLPNLINNSWGKYRGN